MAGIFTFPANLNLALGSTDDEMFEINLEDENDMIELEKEDDET
jgi:hypothetical protein